MYTCPKCGFFIEDGDLFCNHCGARVGVAPRKSKKKTIIIVIVVAIVALLLVGVKLVYDAVARANYMYDAEECAYLMLDGCVDAETACNKIVAVWNNSIWQTDDPETNQYTTDEDGYFYDDFNDALESLFSDKSFQKDISEISDNLYDVNQKMKGLQNPPKGCERAYQQLSDYYDEYYNLMNCALNPTGSLSTFSDDFNDADDKSVKLFNKLMLNFE